MSASDSTREVAVSTTKPAERERQIINDHNYVVQAFEQSSAMRSVSYEREVLCLESGDTEEALDGRLKAEAHLLNIDVGLEAGLDPLKLGDDASLATPTVSTETSRRSGSIDSRSTGFTSIRSEASNDPLRLSVQSFRSPKAFLGRDQDGFFLRRAPHNDSKASISILEAAQFSPASSFSTRSSSLSLPIAPHESVARPTPSPKRSSLRKIRRLSMLKLGRGESYAPRNDLCLHCTQNGDATLRKAIHKLPCGHRRCTPGLRILVLESATADSRAMPACCGIPIPDNLIEYALTKEERMALLERLENWDDFATVVPPSSTSIPAKYTTPVWRPICYQPEKPAADTLAPQVRQDLEWARSRTDFKHLCDAQSQLGDRFAEWAKRQRTTLEEKHSELRAELKSKHESVIAETTDRHDQAMADAEDKQVMAEAEMREVHEQEKRDADTGLKHMEAYCAGMYSTGEPHHRTVSDASRAELANRIRARGNMIIKHDNAINVLRGEQGRRIRLRAQRQEEELRRLRLALSIEAAELEQTCNTELREFDEDLSQRRTRARYRWDLQVAIFACKAEKKEGSVADWQPRNSIVSESNTVGLPFP